MAIFDIFLDINEEYKELIKDLYKVLIIIILFHLMIANSGNSKNFIINGLMGKAFNDEFMFLSFFILLSIMGYYLIFDKIVSFQ
jgi:hypothetical protein